MGGGVILQILFPANQLVQLRFTHSCVMRHTQEDVASLAPAIVTSSPEQNKMAGDFQSQRVVASRLLLQRICSLCGLDLWLFIFSISDTTTASKSLVNSLSCFLCG